MMTWSEHRKGSARRLWEWCKSKLQVHYEIYREKMYMYKESCCNKSCALFATVNRLTNPLAPLPLELIYTSKCNEFAESFNDKVQSVSIPIQIFTPSNQARNLEVIMRV
ncbi:hypothetical protein NQD34_012911 [Periophthalmus magnuspinnatus]|nr:hypothetical protein NQD34_012911 [Periophthalmus magnuspinnatus]